MAMAGHLVVGMWRTWLAVLQMSVHSCELLKDAGHYKCNLKVLMADHSLHSVMPRIGSLAGMTMTV